MTTDVYKIVVIESVLPDGFYFLCEVVDKSEIGREMLGKEIEESRFVTAVSNGKERQSTDHKHRGIVNSMGQLESITWNFGLPISSIVQFFSFILSCLNEKEVGN